MEILVECPYCDYEQDATEDIHDEFNHLPVDEGIRVDMDSILGLCKKCNMNYLMNIEVVEEYDVIIVITERLEK